MKRKKFLILLSALCISCFAFFAFAACNGNGKIVQFNVDIREGYAPQYTQYALPVYYASFENGEVSKADVKVTDETGSEVGVFAESFYVEQEIGQKYTVVYSAGEGRNKAEYSLTLTVTSDELAPELRLLREVVCVGVGDYVKPSDYFVASDDSKVAPTLRYDAQLNGEPFAFSGSGFTAEAGVYRFDVTAADMSGHLSETRRLTIVARTANVIADFETEEDIRTAENNGVRVQGAAAPVRSNYVTHGGEYSLYLDNSAGNARTRVIPFTQDGSTNTVTVTRGDILGIWYYFLPKDASDHINMRFEISQLYDPVAFSDIEFYIDGAYYAGGSSQGGFLVSLPVNTWIYMQCNVQNVDTNFYIQCAPYGYNDTSFRAYIDDIALGLKTDLQNFSQVVNSDGGQAEIDVADYFGAMIYNYNVNYNRVAANYVVFREDGNILTKIEAVSGSRYSLGIGEYRVYIANSAGIYAGIYGKLSVRNDPFSEVVFDMDGNEIAPIGRAGTEYPVFGVTADENISYTVSVYKDYKHAGEKEYRVQNGRFLPDAPGIYTIVYSLEKDGFSADRTFSVTVVEEVPALVSDYYTLEKAETAFVGAEYELPQVTVYGGTGRTSCLIEVYDGDGAILEHNGESIVFPEPGIYTIRHTIRDYIDARSYEYSVNVTLNGDPLCNEDAFFPRFFSDGFEYELQPLTAKLYAEDGTFSEKETKIYCRYGGTETPVENNIFVPHVNENGDTVTIVYKAARADGSLAEVKSYEVPVLKVCSEGKIDAAANFAANGLSVTASEDGVVLQTETEGAVSYGAPLLLNSFEVMMSVPAENNALSEIELLLSDYDNPSVRVSLKIIRSGNGAVLEYNGERTEMAGSFGSSFTISYDGFSRTFSDGAQNAVAVLESGLFAGGKVNLDIRLGGTDGEKKLVVRYLNGQALNNDIYDYSVPNLFVDSYTIVNEQGDLFALPRTIVADNYDINPSLKVSVLYQGQPVTALDGTLLSNADYGAYEIQLTQAGSYSMQLTVSDLFGNQRTFYYSIWAFGEANYEFVYSGNMPQEAKTGDEISVPSANVKGNGEQQVFVYLRDPQHFYSKVENGRVTFSMSGKYTLIYYTVDADHNAVSEAFEIVVR